MRDVDTDLNACREKSVMTMNTPVQNADDVAEPVYALTLNSARNSCDGKSGMTADAPLHDECVLAVRDEFIHVNNEEVSDEDVCMSRSTTIKAINTIMTERVWINCAASKIVFQLSTRTPATRCTMRV